MLTKILAIGLIAAFVLRFFVRYRIRVGKRSIRLVDLALILIAVTYGVQLLMLAV